MEVPEKRSTSTDVCVRIFCMAERRKTVYQAIKGLKEKYGVYFKTCLHLHTPASYDYHLKSNWDASLYKKASTEQLFRMCIEKSVFPPMTQIEDIKPEDWNGYKSEKDFFTYLLVANELVANRYGIVVVTDHQSIAGIEPLQKAIDFITKYKSYEVYPHVICGIEISCADKNHVVGIFDDDEITKNKLTEWLNVNIYSREEGVVKASLEVLEFLRSIGATGYIAHIDSSNSFGKEHFSGAYKKTVLEKESIFGLGNLEHQDYQMKIIQTIVQKDFNFVLDNDAHDIDGICCNPIWIKCEKRSCSAIKEAFCNYQTSILLSEPSKAKKYIEGIYISHRDNGFLCDKNDKAAPFIMRFSDELNCLIGGRGTGKSTVLDVLEYALAQRCASVRELEFICKHGTIYVLYWDNGNEYLIEMHTADKPEGESILKCFGQNLQDRYNWHYRFSPSEITKYARDYYVDVYQVFHQRHDIQFIKQSAKRALLWQMFDTGHSVNELVSTASGDDISKYLYNILFENRTLTNSSASISCRSFNGLKKTVNDVDGILNERAAEVNSVIEPFNRAKKGVFQIIYSQKAIPHEPKVDKWIGFSKKELSEWYSFRGTKFNLKNENSIEYLLSLYYKVGFLEFVKICVNRDSIKAEENVHILSFCTEMNQTMVDAGIEQLKSRQSSQIVSDLLGRTVSPQNVDLVIHYLKQVVEEIEEFSLEFNINNKESVQSGKPDYRDVRNLSLGQKVVAMLSFILGYSEYINDYRPLVIDQPEDNLDNQYIYKNLVQQLREAKSKRQVIIATHNATLVTNTSAEQVCIMQSNGDNGWIDISGYVGTPKIKKHIVNYLEGGIESFVHKCEIYHDILPKE